MSVTKRLTAKIFTLPRVFRRPEPVLTDGRRELEVAYQVHELLQPLPSGSQQRILHHVNDILQEREQQYADYREALTDEGVHV